MSSFYVYFFILITLPIKSQTNIISGIKSVHCQDFTNGCTNKNIACPTNEDCTIDCNTGCLSTIINATNAKTLSIHNCNNKNLTYNYCHNMVIYCPLNGRGGSTNICELKGDGNVSNTDIYTEEGFNDLTIEHTLTMIQTVIYCGKLTTNYECIINSEGTSCDNTANDLTCNDFIIPTDEPSTEPSQIPSYSPTKSTINPTSKPTLFPSNIPSNIPSNVPTFFPSNIPTKIPTIYPTVIPTLVPSSMPSSIPTLFPSNAPTNEERNDIGASTTSFDTAAHNSNEIPDDNSNPNSVDSNSIDHSLISVVIIITALFVCVIIGGCYWRIKVDKPRRVSSNNANKYITKPLLINDNLESIQLGSFDSRKIIDDGNNNDVDDSMSVNNRDFLFSSLSAKVTDGASTNTNEFIVNDTKTTISQNNTNFLFSSLSTKAGDTDGENANPNLKPDEFIVDDDDDSLNSNNLEGNDGLNTTL